MCWGVVIRCLGPVQVLLGDGCVGVFGTVGAVGTVVRLVRFLLRCGFLSRLDGWLVVGVTCGSNDVVVVRSSDS